MDTTPLLNQDIDPSDSDQDSSVLTGVNHYVARITPCDKFSYQQLKDFIEAEPQFCMYVIGHETTPKEHFHLVLSTDESVELQDVKDIIRAFLNPLWATDKGTLPKGFGNKQYNCQESDDVERGISYAIKDCTDYIYSGWEPEYIQELKERSFTKKSKHTFTTEFQELKKTFLDTSMDISEFMTKFVILKSKYEQMVNLSHAYQYALSLLIKRDNSEAENFVDNFLYKQ